ncbi:MAG: hypothetical protein LBJ10_02425, partial [Clostridiales bacterium]|nr:hypothetical protein [Clostridiales bacterium]
MYEGRSAELTAEDFQNPGSEYRAAPFWAWNCKLDPVELCRQIEIFKKMGYGGFHMHVRTGLDTPYLGGEFMDAVGACVEKAREERMLAWLYDEDRWPSGAAGGLVTMDERYRMAHLLITRTPYAGGRAPEGANVAGAASGRAENGAQLACFDIELDAKGCLKAYRRIAADERPALGFKLYAYAEKALPSPWYNNQTYVDTLNP